MKLLIGALFFILALPACSESIINQEEMLGEWESLGASFTRTREFSKLISPGENRTIFLEDANYQYISLRDGNEKETINGTWVFKGDSYVITRPDSGTFEYNIISYVDGVIESRNTFSDGFHYLKKK